MFYAKWFLYNRIILAKQVFNIWVLLEGFLTVLQNGNCKMHLFIGNTYLVHNLSKLIFIPRWLSWKSNSFSNEKLSSKTCSERDVKKHFSSAQRFSYTVWTHCVPIFIALERGCWFQYGVGVWWSFWIVTKLEHS